ncbi:MAG TPA: hypothetical protein VER98_10810, partial [Terriglobia bacterium]|nr:hypothetical protein [Terriglobia bacterium]
EDASAIKRKGAVRGVSRRSILKWLSGDIGRADDAEAASVEDMRVPLGCRDVDTVAPSMSSNKATHGPPSQPL